MLKKILKSNSGMTLIEIMVVVAIIAGITGLVAVNVMKSSDEADIKMTQTQIANIMNALDQYRLENKKYPKSDEGLDVLVKSEVLKKLPKDPWGGEYQYASPGNHGNKVEVWSMGPDQEEDTEDDIKSWESNEDEK